MSEIYIYSDGGSINNGGKNKDKDVYGAFCCLIVNPKTKKIMHTITEVYKDVTNNQMELIGVLLGISWVSNMMKKKHPKNTVNVTIISDSQYVIKGASEWMPNWKKKNWRNSSGKTVENIKLWKRFDKLLENPQIEFEFKWTRGHKGKSISLHEDMDSYYNEQCDTILSEELKPYRK